MSPGELRYATSLPSRPRTARMAVGPRRERCGAGVSSRCACAISAVALLPSRDAFERATARRSRLQLAEKPSAEERQRRVTKQPRVQHGSGTPVVYVIAQAAATQQQNGAAWHARGCSQKRACRPCQCCSPKICSAASEWFTVRQSNRHPVDGRWSVRAYVCYTGSMPTTPG